MRLSLKKSLFLIFFTITQYSMTCFEPIAGENQWRMIARVGQCVNENAQTTSAIEQDLLSISDSLLSAIDSANCCSEIDLINSNLLSISDILVSQIEVIDDKLDLLTASALEELASIAEKLLETMQQIDSIADEVIGDLSIIDSLIELSTETIISHIEIVDDHLLSISDTLVSAIDAANCCSEIDLINTNLLSISDTLTSRLEEIDSHFYSSVLDLECPCDVIAWDARLEGNVSVANPIVSISQSPDAGYVIVAETVAANAGNKIEIYQQSNLSLIIGALNDALSDVVSVRFSPILTPTNTYLIAVARKTNAGADPELLMFEFDPAGPSLTLVDSVNLDADVNGIAWRPSGDRLLVAQDVNGSELLLYTVNTTTGALSFNSSLSLNGSVVYEQALDWNPGFTDYAIATTTMVGLNPNIYTILFDGTATSMSIEVATTLTAPVNVLAISWSPSGEYIVAGTLEGIVGISHFTPGVSMDGFGAAFIGSAVRTVSWNPHGTLFAIGAEAFSGNELQVYCFDPSGAPSTLVAGYDFTGTIAAVDWDPNSLLSVGTDFANGGISLYSFTPLLLDSIAKIGCHLLECCEELNSKIDTLVSNPCDPIPLFSTSSVTLSTPSTSYCLPEDFNGNITIDAQDIVLDLSGHVVQGLIDITNNGHNALIHNGKIASSTPVDNTQADYGVVHIASNARNVHIINCIIQTGSVQNGSSTNSFTALNIEGNYALISHCDIRTDSGGNGLIGGNAGHCIVVQNSAEHTAIVKCRLSGGFGGSANTALVTSTGAGGAGIVNAGRNTLVRLCDIQAGTGGNLLDITGDVANGVAVTLGIGGNAITNTGTGLSVYNSILQAGSGGAVTTVTTGNIGMNAGGSLVVGGGGDALYVNSDPTMVISECELYAGDSGFINSIEGIGILGANVAAARGGYGIWCEFGFSSSYGPVVNASTIYAGSSGSFNASNGDIGSLTSSIATDAAGDGVHITTYGMVLSDCVIIGGNGATVSASNGNIFNTNSGRGGHGVVDLSGTRNSILGCQIEAGLGGSMNASGDIFATTFTGNGGIGILLDGSTFTLIEECSISARTSGSSAAGTTNQSTSGEGGIGIFITGISDGVRIRSTSIGPTGASGNVSGIGGTSGPGGDGIRIDVNVGFVDPVEISDCKINYTGAVGTADTPSTSPGQAIRDLTPNAMIYTNYAEDTADTVTPYTLAIGAAVDAPTGTAFLVGGLNRLENIYR